MALSKSSVSVKDVAALAGVSVGTVSNVINSPDVVSAATRQRVEERSPNSAGSATSRRASCGPAVVARSAWS